MQLSCSNCKHQCYPIWLNDKNLLDVHLSNIRICVTIQLVYPTYSVLWTSLKHMIFKCYNELSWNLLSLRCCVWLKVYVIFIGIITAVISISLRHQVLFIRSFSLPCLLFTNSSKYSKMWGMLHTRHTMAFKRLIVHYIVNYIFVFMSLVAYCRIKKILLVRCGTTFWNC